MCNWTSRLWENNLLVLLLLISSHGLLQFYTQIERKTVIVNLDPANDNVPYKAEIDINQLITLADVMKDLKLGLLV